MTDGRLMAKILITTIQVDLVPNPIEGNTNLPEFSLLNFFAISLPSQSFLGCHFDFSHLFPPGFLGPRPFSQLGYFCIDC